MKPLMENFRKKMKLLQMIGSKLINYLLIFNRLYLLGRITHELQQFKLHNDHVEWWKMFWPTLKDDLLSSQIIIRWDFIGIIKFYSHNYLQKIMFMKIVMQCLLVILEKSNLLF